MNNKIKWLRKKWAVILSSFVVRTLLSRHIFFFYWKKKKTFSGKPLFVSKWIGVSLSIFHPCASLTFVQLFFLCDLPQHRIDLFVYFTVSSSEDTFTLQRHSLVCDTRDDGNSQLMYNCHLLTYDNSKQEEGWMWKGVVTKGKKTLWQFNPGTAENASRLLCFVFRI